MGGSKKGKGRRIFSFNAFSVWIIKAHGAAEEDLQPLSAQQTTEGASQVPHLFPNFKTNVSAAETLWQEKLRLGMKSAKFPFPFLVAKDLTDSPKHSVLPLSGSFPSVVFVGVFSR